MIRIITQDNLEEQKDILDECFRLRYEVFVKELGWKDVNKASGFETDQFDTEEAIHVVAIDNEKVVGYSRLLASTEPHLLSEVFSHLATSKPVPVSPYIHEWTRYCVAKSHRGGSAFSRTASELICGVMEYCEENLIHSLTAVYEAVWITRFLELGFDVIPLGLPQNINGNMIVGVQMNIQEVTLGTTRVMRGVNARTIENTQSQDI